VVSLAEAREKAHQSRKLIEAGENPIAAKRQAALKKAGTPTFAAVADELIASKQREWRNEKHRAQWQSSLTTLAASLRPLPIDEIDTLAVLAVLKPLWLSKPETAVRLRGRIEAVMDAGKAKGHRSGENPAAWRGHLAHLLPKRASLSRGHHSAMDYREVPQFVAKLRELGSVSAMALEFCILTAARSGEVYGVKWAEIDLATNVLDTPRLPNEGWAPAPGSSFWACG
jgi:integrase